LSGFRKIEQGVDCGDGQALGTLGNFDDVVASAHLTLF
jgi:hypothetical protein